ncbi:FAD-dependent oxidoreductase [Dactylosporangium salmoneum]|uniref:NAD(P)-binding domain-containing protein n=1 Tax=Dactylosporangium salmoneum TaxID=53361 RepID=A0ABN3FXI5_9ACTN
MTSQLDGLPVVVIGAGPVGLAAAAHLAERGIAFTVLEAGDRPAAAVREWGHVRLFSPWRYNIDAAARRLLVGAGWVEPDPEVLPTGAQLADDYLQALADAPALKPHIRYGARVRAVTRLGVDRLRTAGRDAAPFLVRLDGDDVPARAVIDASGTWTTPNVLGASGIPARGEEAVAGFIEQALPDVLGADRDRFAGRRTLVVGAGHSAANTLLFLAELAGQAPETSVVWAIRSSSAARTYGGETADALPARGAIGTRLREHVEAGTIELIPGFSVQALTVTADGLVTASDGSREITADRIVSATGFRPDHGMTGELRLDLDPILGAARALAPLIDPNEHSCGTVPPHGVDELTHPEAGYYAVGVKSYGRAPTFLLATGYEQARSVVAALAGDWEAARDVHLDLPETGVCSSDVPLDSAAITGGGCCGPTPVATPAGRGLATGVSGGLLATPLTLLPVVGPGGQQQSGDACCG